MAEYIPQSPKKRSDELTHPHSTARKQLEQSLEGARANLTNWVCELEQRIQEIDLLSEMDDQLQTCRTITEVVTVFIQFMRQLFGTEAGALYLFPSTQMPTQPTAVWGKLSSADWQPLSCKCWVLRSQIVQVSAASHFVPRSSNRHGLLPTNYLCIPIPVRGTVMGLLQIRCIPPDEYGSSDERVMPEYLSESKQRLVLAVAELIALALENLHQPEVNSSIYREAAVYQPW
jgi:GAF domain-containing protein